MKLRYVFAVLLILLSLGSGIGAIIYALIIGWTLYTINKIEKSKKDGQLTSEEKWPIIITELVNPVIGGAFYYYCLKNKFPKKANQANKYSWTIVAGELTIIVLLAILSTHH